MRELHPENSQPNPRTRNEDIMMRSRIGQNISLRREHQGLSQSQLAKEVGCSRWVISRVETGRAAIAGELLPKIQFALRMKSTDDFFREPFEE